MSHFQQRSPPPSASPRTMFMDARFDIIGYLFLSAAAFSPAELKSDSQKKKAKHKTSKGRHQLQEEYCSFQGVLTNNWSLNILPLQTFKVWTSHLKDGKLGRPRFMFFLLNGKLRPWNINKFRPCFMHWLKKATFDFEQKLAWKYEGSRRHRGDERFRCWTCSSGCWLPWRLFHGGPSPSCNSAKSELEWDGKIAWYEG